MHLESTKLDKGVVYHESWKPVYFRINSQRSRGTNNSAGVGVCTLATAGFFYYSLLLLFKRRLWKIITLVSCGVNCPVYVVYA